MLQSVLVEKMLAKLSPEDVLHSAVSAVVESSSDDDDKRLLSLPADNLSRHVDEGRIIIVV